MLTGILIALPMVLHEMGHFFVALIFGKRIRFTFAVGNFFEIPVPRATWRMPQGLTKNQQRLVSQAGFAVEFLAMPFLPWIYSAVALAHFLLYPWYAGMENDFTGMGQVRQE